MTDDQPTLEERIAALEARAERAERGLRALAAWSPNYGDADYRALGEIIDGTRE